MPTTHIWKGASGPFIFDPTQYVDGTAFIAGDTLVVSSGEPTIVSTSSTGLANLATGTYQFAIPGATAGLQTSNITSDGASAMAVTGPGTLEWFMQNQFVSSGAIQVGSAAASGNVDVLMSTTDPATLTNQGSITVQNGSLFRLQTITTSSAFVNAARAVVSINSGSLLASGNYYGYSSNGQGNLNTTNNGGIEVTGAAGRSTAARFAGSYAGSGLLSVRGTPGAPASDTQAEISGAASGLFAVASGELYFHTTPVGGGINCLDNNAAIVIDLGVSTSYGTQGNPFGATILGFQAGDVITLKGFVAATAYTYDPGSHLLTVTYSGTQVAQLKFAGSYTQSDFQVAPSASFSGQGLDITTTSTSQAVPAFSTVDNVTGTAGSSAGQQYVGPVSTLQSQYIWASPDGASITAFGPNVFLGGGAGNDALTASAGSNVLDGGLGSNFVTGATGADGGADTFFLDGTAGTTWDTITNFHPGDSATLWGYVPGRSATVWGANEGAAGHTGATLHAAFAGAGTAINGSLTFAGLGLADAQSKLSLTPGSAGGRSYLYVHYNP